MKQNDENVRVHWDITWWVIWKSHDVEHSTLSNPETTQIHTKCSIMSKKASSDYDLNPRRPWPQNLWKPRSGDRRHHMAVSSSRKMLRTQNHDSVDFCDLLMTLTSGTLMKSHTHTLINLALAETMSMILFYLVRFLVVYLHLAHRWYL